MSNRQATVRARGLGTELRELREKRGLGLRDVAKRLGLSASSLSRTENGLRLTGIEEVAALLVVYEVTGPRWDRLLNLARDSDHSGWWETGHTKLPSQLTALIGFESQATRIIEAQLAIVPGLLQTADYSRALLQAGGVPGAETETRVAMRLGRQAVLTRPQPPSFLALVDEAALRRPVGGPAVMAEQLRHVCKLAERPNVSVRVIPFGEGAHAGMAGAYMVLSFTKEPTIVHLEHKRAGVFLDQPEDIGPYVAAVDTLQRQAFDAGRSIAFIASLATVYENQQGAQ
jgi:transcriptional regulator with XRE-family HTH domain